MRISDWSSDVCSSDLAETPAGQPVDIVPFDRRRTPARAGRTEHAFGEQHVEIRNLAARPHAADRPARWPRLARQARANRRRKTPRLLIAMRETRWHLGATRSEERRVGKECVRTCRYRWSPYH